jgi:ElaB/YqjD/DUF883 family membrane-anchored ribosome-binding protein
MSDAEAKQAGLLETAKEKIARGTEIAKEKVKEVDEKVHANPWPAVAGAFVGGLLLGFILGHKRSG